MLLFQVLTLHCRILQRCNGEWIRAIAQQKPFDRRIGFVVFTVIACLEEFYQTPLEAFEFKTLKRQATFDGVKHILPRARSQCEVIERHVPCSLRVGEIW